MPELKPHLKDLYRTEQREFRENYLRLDMNESVNGLPDSFIQEVLQEINGKFLSMYPEYRLLEKKLADHNEIKESNICLSPGSNGAIKYIFDAYISQGDKVLITDPTFAMYRVYCRMFGAESVSIPYNNDLTFPFDQFINTLSEKIKMAVLVNPNNPTGTVLEKERILHILDKGLENDVLMLVDEAYFYFYPETMIQEINKYSNIIILRTLSKLCGIASLRIGYAVACEQIIKNIRIVKPTYDVNNVAVLFAHKLIDNIHILENLIHDFIEGKKYLVSMLSENNYEYIEGSGNFILIKCNKNITDIIEQFDENKILISGGFTQDFLKDYIRVSIGNVDTMNKFWKVFLKVMSNK